MRFPYQLGPTVEPDVLSVVVSFVIFKTNSLLGIAPVFNSFQHIRSLLATRLGHYSLHTSVTTGYTIRSLLSTHLGHYWLHGKRS
jgi:hypothetical protein